MITPFNLSLTSHTHFAVAGETLAMKYAAKEHGPASIVAAPEGSTATVASDADRTFTPDKSGLYKLRFGAVGDVGWREVALYVAAPETMAHRAYDGKARKLLHSLFAVEPLSKLDLEFMADPRHPWPLHLNSATGEWSSPNWQNYGG